MRSSRGKRVNDSSLTRCPVQSSCSTPKHEQARIAAATLCGYFGSMRTTAGAFVVPSAPLIEVLLGIAENEETYRLAPTSAVATAPRPAALRSASARSVRSQVNPGPLRPKCPYAAVAL